jgi:antirestriction protein ArdC
MGYAAHCETVAAQIISRLENGELPPWSRPWHTLGTDAPVSSHGRHYRGINRFILGMIAAERGYSSPIWITFKQAQAIGGTVRKGENAKNGRGGTKVIGWGERVITTEDEDTGEKKTTSRLQAFVFTVFNTEQCDGLDPDRLPNLPTRADTDTEVSPLQRAVAIIENMPNRPSYLEGGDIASYDPRMDLVRMPPACRYMTPEAHAGTAFHEFAHATGHPSRLDRGLGTTPTVFNSVQYGVWIAAVTAGALTFTGSRVRGPAVLLTLMLLLAAGAIWPNFIPLTGGNPIFLGYQGVRLVLLLVAVAWLAKVIFWDGHGIKARTSAPIAT